MWFRKSLEKAFGFQYFILFSLLILSCSSSQKENRISFDAMNTYMTVRSFGAGDSAVKANGQVQNRIEQLENLLSATKENSEVWKINHNSGKAVQISEDTAKLARFTINMSTKTDGILNPCLYPVIREWGFTTGQYKVPSDDVISELLQHTDYRKVVIGSQIIEMSSTDTDLAAGTTARSADAAFIKLEDGMMLDFGAVGKGYAGDEAIKVLRQNGIKSAMLDLGGNIQVLGSKPDGSFWNVGIKNPWGGEPVAGVKIMDKAVITSGGYERYFVDEKTGHKYIHIFDSKTGRPVENNVVSVTIIADSGLYADALSTSLLVMGESAAVKFWNQYRDFDFIMILNDDGTAETADAAAKATDAVTPTPKLIYTAGLEKNLTLLYDFATVEMVGTN